ncbi:OB-fold domain-containing protein [Mycobacterium sp.]|uniref:Zn-ribbon domain-containing OB-fold protein n=1 Tax=Mycobacterium sp. TaxID=1785 RepID=UPI0011FCCC58|nr:OB-fold domain-containing protein [Mycobacterium sp.]TAM73049.1 MAG: hypothetical protein EPN51_01695 [Mycobacterium sp.]
MPASPTRKSAAPAPDPRPVVLVRGDFAVVAGSRCVACGYPGIEPVEACPVCRAQVSRAEFGPAGTVFAATILRIALPERPPPYGLAYVDLDGGPRILAHGYADRDTCRPLAPGDRVRLTGRTALGDPFVELEAPL